MSIIALQRRKIKQNKAQFLTFRGRCVFDTKKPILADWLFWNGQAIRLSCHHPGGTRQRPLHSFDLDRGNHIIEIIRMVLPHVFHGFAGHFFQGLGLYHKRTGQTHILARKLDQHGSLLGIPKYKLSHPGNTQWRNASVSLSLFGQRFYLTRYCEFIQINHNVRRISRQPGA